MNIPKNKRGETRLLDFLINQHRVGSYNISKKILTLQMIFAQYFIVFKALKTNYQPSTAAMQISLGINGYGF